MALDVSKQSPVAEAGGRLRRGTNQSDMRDHNERIVLSLIREHGPLAKTDIARISGLTLQTVSVIMRELEQTSLLLRQEPLRGKVGQPSIPMALNPDGAFFFGLKVGRRSSELVLIDFLGSVRSMRSQSYPYPTPEQTVTFTAEGIQAMRADLPSELRGRVAGLGIAFPFELWNWVDAAGAPASVMDDWRDCDIRGELQARLDFPVYLQNDATSACGAELAFGGGKGLRDFVYFYIGAFAGGGVVLNGRLFSGMTGNAGALGSMPVPSGHRKPVQLIDRASLTILEKALQRRGVDAHHLWTSPQDWGDVGEDAEHWIADAGDALAYAIASACAVIDFEVAIIDGWMPARIRALLVAAIREGLQRVDIEGLSLPDVREGTVGIHARALGGASLPLAAKYHASIAS